MSKTAKFPRRFLWGASLSAHQVEGNLHNQWTVWEQKNAPTLAARASYQLDDLKNWSHIAQQAQNPRTYVSGEAVDHFRRYEEDFDIIESLGLDALRFSIEWSRVEPKEGVWDARVITHYRAYLKSLKARGITPVVTLFHFTVPVWFAKKGGFEKHRNVKYFVRFAEKILDELGEYMSWIVTVNEPTVYVYESYWAGEWPPNKTGKVLGVRVLRNILRAHRQIHALTKHHRRLRVSMAHRINHFYAGDDARLSRMSAWLADLVVNRYVISRVKRTSDFLALNYYCSNRIYGYRVHNPEKEWSDLGWDLQPEHLQDVLVSAANRWHLPIMVTGNGLADSSDEQRQKWLEVTIRTLYQAVKDDIELIGYLHWSFLDSFEWDKGFWPKFGLVSVDRSTMKRTVRKSAQWYGRVVKRLR